MNFNSQNRSKLECEIVQLFDFYVSLILSKKKVSIIFINFCQMIIINRIKKIRWKRTFKLKIEECLQVNYIMLRQSQYWCVWVQQSRPWKCASYQIIFNYKKPPKINNSTTKFNSKTKFNVEEHGQASQRATNAGGTSCRIHCEYPMNYMLL